MSDTSCEMPDSNPLDNEIEEIFNQAKTIAIVGLSDKPERDSNKVAVYLENAGYEIIPVNPMKDELLGKNLIPILNQLANILILLTFSEKVDAIPGVVDEAIEVGASVVWMQLGLAHHVSAEKARKAGLKVVQSKCTKIEHKKLEK